MNDHRRIGNQIATDNTRMPGTGANSVPVLFDVDVLVIGSTSAAVAAALAVRSNGQSAAVISDLSYLGSDFAGTFQLWPGEWRESDPLLAAAFDESAVLPARPGAIKRVMEEALLAARIPFLFHGRPVALLRDDLGNPAGAILAVRTSLMAVTCRAIIDASEYGIGARLAGVVLRRRELSSSIEWTVLGTQAPTVWPGEIEEIQPKFVQHRPDGDVVHRGFRLRIDRQLLGSDPMAREHVARSLLVDENVAVAADLLVDAPGEIVSPRSALADRVFDLDAAVILAAPNLWILSEMLPLSLEGVNDFRRPDRKLALARRIGAAAAAAILPDRPSAGGVFVQTGGTQAGDYRFAPVFLRGERTALDLDDWAFPTLASFDVVVAGGGTGGAPAGIAAARAGASTLVLEMQHGLGGIGTLGLISSYWFGNRVGFTAELNEEVSRHDSWSRSKEGASWKPGVKSSVYHQLLQSAGGRAWTGSFAFGVKMNGDHVVGLLVSTPHGSGCVSCAAVVDASGNSDVAAAAGSPCRVIGAEHAAVQGAGMSSKVHADVGYQNSDHTFIDDADPIGVTAAFVHARAKYPADFDTVSMVNSRERRQIVGEAEVSPLDILAHRTYPDTVFVACSNFDTHGFTIHPVFMIAPPDHEPIRANVPFRCMLPKGIDGVVVTGLGMSAHRDALPLLRMQADVQNQGYVAGLAAAESVARGIKIRALDVRALQRQLVELGVLEPDALEQRDSFPMSADAIREAASGSLGELVNIAVLLAHPAQSRGPLLEAMANDPDPQCRRDAARLLGMMGERRAAPVLEETIRSAPWDEGWNFRGMGQFGSSMSWLDSALIALGRTGCYSGVPAIESKILALDSDAEFSHCRAVALAAAMLPDSNLAAALERLLARPGVRGHALNDLEKIRGDANGNATETDSRNRSLREIYLAMGLLLTGESNGTGRAILESYTGDLRGPLARYSQALLAAPDHESLRHLVA